MLIATIKTQLKWILVNLDNKIELNDKTIEKFEELTKAYFKHWFEEFEFPDKNGNPYKTSGGKMIETEIGKIPEKWYVKKLNQLKKRITFFYLL